MFRQTAHVYDLIYEASGKDYLAESDEIHRLIKARDPRARTLLDVAFGTGGHLRYLRQWYDVVGVDIDPGMLNLNRIRPERSFPRSGSSKLTCAICGSTPVSMPLSACSARSDT